MAILFCVIPNVDEYINRDKSWGALYLPKFYYPHSIYKS